MSADTIRLRIPNYPSPEEWKKALAELNKTKKETSDLKTEHDGEIKKTDEDIKEEFQKFHDPTQDGYEDENLFYVTPENYDDFSNVEDFKDRLEAHQQIERFKKEEKAMEQRTPEERAIFEQALADAQKKLNEEIGGKRKRTKKARRSKKRKTTKKKRRSKKRKTTKKK